MLEIVAGIGDHGQRSGRQDAVEAERQLGAADPARQREHKTLVLAHRKRSCSGGRTKCGSRARRARTRRGRAPARSAPPRRPGPSTARRRRRSRRQSRSRSPAIRARRGRDGRADRSNAGNPAAPSATPTVPLRQGRPKLSLMMTRDADAEDAPSNAAASAWAEPSGSTGSSSTRSPPSSGATFEWSMPALAMTKPRRCSTISRPGRWRTTRLDSDRTTSTKRGSLSTSAASAIARSRRLDGRDIDIAPLGLGDDLLRHDQHIAVLRRQRQFVRATRRR